MAWTTADIPDLTGRTAVITGANSGIGYHAALELARHGARVVAACRHAGRGGEAVRRIAAEAPRHRVELAVLDLADLASVRRFAEASAAEHPGLDLLINNAGVMALPMLRTADGFEMQFGTNHLGHFALTGLLLPRLLSRPGARVVTVSSNMHRLARIDFGNLAAERNYRRWGAYAQSKLANLLFTVELQRRAEAAGAALVAVAAHPGYASTNLQTAGPQMAGSRLRIRQAMLLNRLFGQSAEMGALPTLYAATNPTVRGGQYIGPTGRGGSRGHPGPAAMSGRAQDADAARRLWEVSEQLTGVRYEALSPA